jgi:hypothetical protein
MIVIDQFDVYLPKALSFGLDEKGEIDIFIHMITALVNALNRLMLHSSLVSPFFLFRRLSSNRK